MQNGFPYQKAVDSEFKLLVVFLGVNNNFVAVSEDKNSQIKPRSKLFHYFFLFG